MENPQLKQLLKTLEEVNSVIKNLDPAIREKAFELVADHLGSDLPPARSGEAKAATKAKKKTDNGDPPRQPVDTSSTGAFFGGFDHSKPAANVLLIVAWLFSKYGVFPISTAEIKEIADAVGITVPTRIDMTLKVAKRQKKTLFQKIGKNYRLTVSGELFMKETYGVLKGTSPRSSE